jgi:hypothetical protein
MNQESLKNLVCGVIKSDSQNLLITGLPGLGKSHSVLSCVKEIGLSKESYLYVNGYLTARALFDVLGEANRLNNPKLLLLDDLDEGMLSDKKFLALLKGALWENGGKRVVSYFTNKEKKQIEVKAKIIIIANEISKKSLFFPIIDRLIHYNFEMKKEEIIKVAEDKILPAAYKNLNFGDRKIVFEYIKTLPSFSFRSIIKGFECYMMDKKLWRQYL